jgi:hypothetical protein
MTAISHPAPEKETAVHHLNSTDHEANGQADGPPGAAVRDADPPVDGGVATEHPPGHDHGHNHAAAPIVAIGEECPAHLAPIVSPLDISTKQTPNRPQEEPMPKRSKTSPTKTRSGGSTPRRRENPKKTTSQDPDATTVAEAELDDAQWLARRPVRKKLADPTHFDREALLWRDTWPDFETMIRRIEARRPDLREVVAMGGPRYCQYARFLEEVFRCHHPDTWHVCSVCQGKGRKACEKEPCSLCAGAGFTWKRIRYREQ